MTPSRAGHSRSVGAAGHSPGFGVESAKNSSKDINSIAFSFSLSLQHTNNYWVSKIKCPAFERLLLPECISNDILQNLIEYLVENIKARLITEPNLKYQG